MSPELAATKLLHGLDVRRPEDIDLERIAHSVGVSIKYRPLTSCEATIVGTMDRGIVSIREDRPMVRQRFSIGHELGHWTYHRGQSFVCQPGDIDGAGPQNKEAERLADSFSSELLMPHYLFNGLAKASHLPTFKHINELAALFKTSEMATAIRVANLGCYPMIVIYHGPQGRRWFNRSSMVPKRWFPLRQLDSDSYAYDLLQDADAKMPSGPSKMDAAAWFDLGNGEDYEVLEESVRVLDGVLTVLAFEDAAMLESRDRT